MISGVSILILYGLLRKNVEFFKNILEIGYTGFVFCIHPVLAYWVLELYLSTVFKYCYLFLYLSTGTWCLSTCTWDSTTGTGTWDLSTSTWCLSTCTGTWHVEYWLQLGCLLVVRCWSRSSAIARRVFCLCVARATTLMAPRTSCGSLTRLWLRQPSWSRSSRRFQLLPSTSCTFSNCVACYIDVYSCCCVTMTMWCTLCPEKRPPFIFFE